MIDIVERLLNYRSGVVSCEYDVPLEVCVAAADEIKRLRKALAGTIEQADEDLEELHRYEAALRAMFEQF